MRDFIDTLHKRSALIFWAGFLFIVSAIASLGLLTFDRSAVQRNNSWFDVFFYSLYTSFTLISLGWLLPILNSKKKRAMYGWCFVLLGISTIIIQWFLCSGLKAKALMVETPQMKMLESILIMSFWTFSVIMSLLTIQVLSQRKVPYSQHYSWGVRMGICIFSISMLLIGVVFTLLQAGKIGPSGIVGIQSDVLIFDGLSFRWPFYISAHSLQIIPLASHYLFDKKRQVVLFSITYAIVFIVFLSMAMLR